MGALDGFGRVLDVACPGLTVSEQAFDGIPPDADLLRTGLGFGRTVGC